MFDKGVYNFSDNSYNYNIKIHKKSKCDNKQWQYHKEFTWRLETKIDDWEQIMKSTFEINIYQFLQNVLINL